MVNTLRHTPRQTRKVNLGGLQGLMTHTTACKQGIKETFRHSLTKWLPTVTVWLVACTILVQHALKSQMYWHHKPTLTPQTVTQHHSLLQHHKYTDITNLLGHHKQYNPDIPTQYNSQTSCEDSLLSGSHWLGRWQGHQMYCYVGDYVSMSCLSTLLARGHYCPLWIHPVKQAGLLLPPGLEPSQTDTLPTSDTL